MVKIGIIDENNLEVNWVLHQYVTNGMFPSVSINDSNQILISLTRDGDQLYCVYGYFNENKSICEWRDTVHYDGGFDDHVKKFLYFILNFNLFIIFYYYYFIIIFYYLSFFFIFFCIKDYTHE